MPTYEVDILLAKKITVRVEADNVADAKEQARYSDSNVIAGKYAKLKLLTMSKPVRTDD